MAQRQNPRHEEEEEEESQEQTRNMMQAQAQRLRDMQREQQDRLRGSTKSDKDKEKDEEAQKRDHERQAAKEADKAESSMEDLKGFSKKGLAAFMDPKEERLDEIRDSVRKSDAELLRLAGKREVDQSGIEALAEKLATARTAVHEREEGKAEDSLRQAQKLSAALDSVAKLAAMNAKPELVKEANRAALTVGTEDEARADALIKNANPMKLEKPEDFLKRVADAMSGYDKGLLPEQGAAKREKGPEAEGPGEDRRRALESMKEDLRRSIASLKGENDDAAKALVDSLQRLEKELGAAKESKPDASLKAKAEGLSRIGSIVGRFARLPFLGRKQEKTRKELGPIVKDAAEHTAREPQAERSRLLRFAAEEYMRSPHPAYRSRLAAIASSISKGDLDGAKRAMSAHMRKIREGALSRAKDPQVAALLRKLIPDSLSGAEQMAVARAALGIAASMRDNLGWMGRIPYLGSATTSQGAVRIYTRALRAAERGELRLSSEQASLAESYVKGAAPRDEIEALSKRVEADPGSASDIARYAAMNAAAGRVRGALPFPGSPGRASALACIKLLESARGRIAAGNGHEDKRLAAMASAAERAAIALSGGRYARRAAMADAFERSLRAASDGEAAKAGPLSDAALALGALATGADRNALSKAAKEYSDSLMGTAGFLTTLSIFRARASLEPRTPRAHARNLAAYFDLALRSARGIDMNEPKLILRLAILYGRAAILKGKDSASARQGAMDYVKGLLGNYSSARKRALLAGDARGAPEGAGAAILSGKTLAEHIGGGDTERGVAAMRAIAVEASAHARALERARFLGRVRSLEGRTPAEAARFAKAYASERKRLERSASRAPSEDEAKARLMEALLVDRSAFLSLLSDLKGMHEAAVRSGEDAIRGGRAPGGIDAEKAQGSSSDIRKARRALDALRRLDTSIRKIDTMNRTSGRSELVEGVEGLLRPGDGLAEVRLAAAKAKSGIELARAQEALMGARDFGVWRSKKELRDANPAYARNLAKRLADLAAGLPSAKEYRGMLDKAGGDPAELKKIYTGLCASVGCKSGKDRKGLYFDPVMNERIYRKTEALYRAEKIEAADASRQRGIARMKLGYMAASNRLAQLEFEKGISRFAGIGLAESGRELLEEIVSHLPTDARGQLRDRIDNLKPGKEGAAIAAMLDELKGNSLMESVKGGKPIYYDAERFEPMLSEAALLLKRGGVKAASGLINKIRNEIHIAECAQRHDMERLRKTHIANIREKEANSVPGMFERRLAAEAHDRNVLLQKPLKALADSFIRSAMAYDDAAILDEKARDSLSLIHDPGQAMYKPSPETVADLLSRLPDGGRGIAIGRESAGSHAGRMAQTASRAAQEKLAAGIFRALARDPDAMDSAIGKLEKEGNAGAALIAQLVALASGIRAEESEKSRMAARSMAISAVNDMRSDLATADGIRKAPKGIQDGVSPSSMNQVHREHAARSAELALAALENDERFLGILESGSRIKAPIYEGLGGPYLSVGSAMGRKGRKPRTFNFMEEMRSLSLERKGSLLSYIVADGRKAQGRFRNEADNEISLRLASAGLRAAPMERGRKAERLEWNEHDAKRIGEANQAFEAIKAWRARGLLDNEKIWEPAEQDLWLERMAQRLESFGRSGTVLAERKDGPSRSDMFFKEGVPLRNDGKKIIDDDRMANELWGKSRAEPPDFAPLIASTLPAYAPSARAVLALLDDRQKGDVGHLIALANLDAPAEAQGFAPGPLSESVKKGTGTWWETGANVFQAQPPSKAALDAYNNRMPGPAGRLDTGPYEGSAIMAAANAEFMKLPPQSREDYERYMNGRQIVLAPEQQAATLSRFRRLLERGEVKDFARYASMSGIAPSAQTSAERMRAMAKRTAEGAERKAFAPEARPPESLIMRACIRSGRADAIGASLSIGKEYLNYLEGARADDPIFSSLKGLKGGKLAEAIVEKAASRLGPAGPNQADNIIDKLKPAPSDPRIMDKVSGDMREMEYMVRRSSLPGSGDRAVSKLLGLIEAEFGKRNGNAERIRASKAYKHIVSRACEKPEAVGRWLGLLELMPDPALASLLMRNAGALMAKGAAPEKLQPALRDALSKGIGKETERFFGAKGSREAYLGELQRIFDIYSGFSTAANDLSRTEGTAFARKMIGRLEDGAPKSAVIDAISNGSPRMNESLAKGKRGRDLKGGLKDFIDNEYREVLGLGFRDIYGQRTNDIKAPEKLGSALSLEKNLTGLPSAYKNIRFGNPDGKSITLNDAPGAAALGFQKSTPLGSFFDAAIRTEYGIKDADMKIYNDPKAPFGIKERWADSIKNGASVADEKSSWLDNAWKGSFSGFKEDISNMKAISGMGLGPKTFGAVDTGANFAIANEKTYGKSVSGMKAAELEELILDIKNTDGAPAIFDKLRETSKILNDNGYYLKSPDLKVLDNDQAVNGIGMKKGSVIIDDPSLIAKIEDNAPVSIEENIRALAKLIRERLEIEE